MVNQVILNTRGLQIKYLFIAWSVNNRVQYQLMSCREHYKNVFNWEFYIVKMMSNSDFLLWCHLKSNLKVLLMDWEVKINIGDQAKHGL